MSKTWNWRWRCEWKRGSSTVGWHLQHTILYTVSGRSQGCCSVVQGRVSGDVVNNAGWSGQAGMTECGYSVHELIHGSHAGLMEPCMRSCICSSKWCSLQIKENFIIVVQKGESVFFSCYCILSLTENYTCSLSCKYMMSGLHEIRAAK